MEISAKEGYLRCLMKPKAEKSKKKVALERRDPAMPPIKRIAKMPLAAIVFLAMAAGPSSKAQTIPNDPQVTCTTDTPPTPPTSPNFSSWFQSGTPALNGVVTPADSLNFPNSPNCSFYQWAFHMFLWLTSPAPPTYCGGGAHVFDSTAFFDVSPPDPSGNRTLIPHACSRLGGIIRFLGLRAAQVGPHGLPMIMEKTGRMIEVVTPPIGPSGRPLVLTPTGRAIEVERIIVGKEGKVTFLSRTGKPIPRARPFFQTRFLHQLRLAPAAQPPIVQKFIIEGRPIFVNLSGSMVEVEQGQAGTDAVLEAQNGSLIYYGIHVNDVYAYFLTAMRQGQISSNAPFPTTASDLTPITSFASAHGVTFPDSNPPTSSALAMELKTSWIEASKLPDPQDYVTMTATIPTYNTNPNQWTPNGQQTVKLALVGMHVVGSTAGHPEMIWATFEHLGNTPNDTYQYVNAGGTTVPVNRDTSGTWLFSASNSAGPFNQMHMTVDPSTGNINACGPTNPDCPVTPGFTITPSDTIRSKAWGGAFNQDPNPIDPTGPCLPTNPNCAAASNSEIISINNSVRSQMPASDVRTNYFMTGATWTIFGAAPIGPFAGNIVAGAEVGTSKMANTTMETYDQGDKTFASGSNCFLCHSGITPNSGVPPPTGCFFGLSHIFTCLQALSSSQMLVHVARLQGTFLQHKIEVTVLNSGTGAPLVGATVTVSDPDSGAVKASGTTAASGTVTLQYARCIEVIGPGELPTPRPGQLKPRPFPVPCDGNVQAPEFAAVSFDAP